LQAPSSPPLSVLQAEWSIPSDTTVVRVLRFFPLRFLSFFPFESNQAAPCPQCCLPMTVPRSAPDVISGVKAVNPEPFTSEPDLLRRKSYPPPFLDLCSPQPGTSRPVPCAWCPLLLPFVYVVNWFPPRPTPSIVRSSQLKLSQILFSLPWIGSFRQNDSSCSFLKVNLKLFLWVGFLTIHLEILHSFFGGEFSFAGSSNFKLFPLLEQGRDFRAPLREVLSSSAFEVPHAWSALPLNPLSSPLFVF